MRKLLICIPLGTFSAFHYMVYIFLSGYNSRTIQDINFKFSAFHSLVEATTYVKFQSARCTGFKVGSFRISPIIIVIVNVRFLLFFDLLFNLFRMAICLERAVPLAFHLYCFYFSADLIVGVPFPFSV